MGVWIILPYCMNYFFDSRETIGLQAAAATTQYGILGHQAPELNLNTWIDGDLWSPQLFTGIPLSSMQLHGMEATNEVLAPGQQCAAQLQFQFDLLAP